MEHVIGTISLLKMLFANDNVYLYSIIKKNAMRLIFVLFGSTRFYLIMTALLRKMKWKQFFKHFFDAVGTLSAFATLIAFVGPWKTPEYTSIGCLLLILGIMLISLAYTYFQMRSIRLLTIPMRPHLKVTIKEGDVLKEKGIIVIPVNNFFDTIVDDVIISKKSVNGQFVLQYLAENPDINQLNNFIINKLKKQYHRYKTISRSRGNTLSWNLGSCVDIEWKDNIYVLFAFTNFDEKNHASISSAQVPNVLSKLMKHLSEIAMDKPVFMPLFGTGLSRLGKSYKRTLLFLFDCIEYMSAESVKIPSGLNIDIKSLKATDVNLDDIKEVLKTTIC